MKNYNNAINIMMKTLDSGSKSVLNNFLENYKLNCLYSKADTKGKLFLDEFMLCGVYRLAKYFDVEWFAQSFSSSVETMYDFYKTYENKLHLVWKQCFINDLFRISQSKTDRSTILSYDKNNSSHRMPPHFKYLATTVEFEDNYYIHDVVLKNNSFVVKIFPSLITIKYSDPKNGKTRVLIDIEKSDYCLTMRISQGRQYLENYSELPCRVLVNEIQAIVYCVTNGLYIPSIERMQIPFYNERFFKVKHFRSLEFFEKCNVELYIKDPDRMYAFQEIFSKSVRSAAFDIYAFRNFAIKCIGENEFFARCQLTHYNLARFVIRKILLALNNRLSILKSVPYTEDFLLKCMMPECLNILQKLMPDIQLDPLSSPSMKSLYKDLPYLNKKKLRLIDSIYSTKRKSWCSQQSK